MEIYVMSNQSLSLQVPSSSKFETHSQRLYNLIITLVVAHPNDESSGPPQPSKRHEPSTAAPKSHK
jgi:hypothetical protein